MPVPEELTGLEGLAVLHYFDEASAPEVILPELNEDGTLMTFEAGSFSTFVITGKPGSNPEPDYRITIPDVIDFGTLRLGMGVVSKQLTLTASGLDKFPNSGKVHVRIRGDFTLATKSGKTLGLTIFTPDNLPLVSGDVFCIFGQTAGGASEKTGSLQIDASAIKFAGDYSRVLTFTYDYRGGGQ
jgi:hypothetical protein